VPPRRFAFRGAIIPQRLHRKTLGVTFLATFWLTWTVRMSLDGKGNFIARWGVDTMAISQLIDGRPMRML